MLLTEEELEELDEEIEKLAEEIEEAEENYEKLTKDEKQVLEIKKMVTTLKRLKASGFKKTEKLGYVFPGVNVTKVNMERNKVDKKEAEDIPDPKVKVLPVSTFGEIRCIFNQQMIAPEVIQQFIYRQAFTVFIVSNQDNSISYGRFMKTLRKPKRSLQEDQTEDTLNLNFGVVIQKHDEREIVLEMDFERPDHVSQNGFD